MPEAWENDKRHIPQSLIDLGFVGMMPIPGGLQLLWKFEGDPIAWDADNNMDWVCDRLIPGLVFVTQNIDESLLGWGYGFRVMCVNSNVIRPVFSIALVRNTDSQGTWSLEELVSNDTRTVWMKIDQEMLDIMSEYGDLHE